MYDQEIEKLDKEYKIKINKSNTKTQAAMLELQRLILHMKYACEGFNKRKV